MRKEQDYTSPDDEIYHRLAALWADVADHWVWVDREKWGEIVDVKQEVHGIKGQRKEELVFLAMLSELTMLAAGRFADDPRRLSPDSDRVRQLICRELRIPTRPKKTRRRLRAAKGLARWADALNGRYFPARRSTRAYKALAL
jgi:hypothetical protein